MDFPSNLLEIVMGTLETYSLVISNEIDGKLEKIFLMDFPSNLLEIVMGTLETYSLVISNEIDGKLEKNFLMDFPSNLLEIVMGTLKKYSLVIASCDFLAKNFFRFPHRFHMNALWGHLKRIP